MSNLEQFQLQNAILGPLHPAKKRIASLDFLMTVRPH
jgi:hypothetical protein